MKKSVMVLFALGIMSVASAQSGKKQGEGILNDKDLQFLKELTEVIIDSSRIYPGQKIAEGMGYNNTGAVLIKPGGRESYPAFWIRDYAMSLETGFVTQEEQRQMLLLTASTQADRTWIT
ncbi:MAG TPA: hypothetical protein VKZ93_01735, partial [Arenibacter sp.]|nr:hypothetical protein [Arenibacter sp.]